MRRVVAFLLALLAVVVTTVGVTVVWGRNQVLDTERYLKSVAPLADDEVIQDELADKVADVISDRIEAEAPLLTGVRPLVSAAAHDFMRSDAFPEIWVGINEVGHTQLVTVLTDEDGTIQLDLDGLVAAVRERVAEAGLAVVSRIPPITLVVDVAEVDGIDSARSTVRLLDRVANVLPFLALLLIGLSVFAARRRLRAGAWLSGVIAVVSVGFVGLVALGASVTSSRVPSSVASEDAVHAYYGHLTALLRNGYLTLAILGAVVCVACASVARWRSGSPAH